MGVTSKPSRRAFLGRSLDVVVQRQTYRNVVYLLLALPFGLLYFSVLTTGFLLDLGLSVTLVGIPLLLALFVGSRYLVAFERWLTIHLLDLDIPASEVFPSKMARDRSTLRERSRPARTTRSSRGSAAGSAMAPRVLSGVPTRAGPLSWSVRRWTHDGTRLSRYHGSVVSVPVARFHENRTLRRRL